MNAILNIAIDDRAAHEMLTRARGVIAARSAIHKVAAAAVADSVRSHFLMRNVRSTRSNYWSKAAEATTHESDATSGRVMIRHPGIVWHLQGGTIFAKPGKALAIPLRDEVHGMRASERFPNKGDAFVFRRRGKAFLAAREGKSLRIYYILLKSVSKPPDATVLPPDPVLSAAANTAITLLIQAHLSRRSAL